MVFHGRNWSLRRLAARTLLAPVLAAGLAAPAVGQTPTPAMAKSTADPVTLLKQGRDALKAGKYDQAQDYARQADKANTGGRWGLWGDTPDSLEKDLRAARGKADKARGEQLAKDAKAAYAKCFQIKNPADRLTALDQAYAMCDQAVALRGPSDLMDDWFGNERPEKLKKEIDTARLQLRRTVPAADLAKTAPKDGVQTALATAKPGAASGVMQAKAQLPMPVLPTPTLPPVVAVSAPDAGVVKAQAAKLVADGRALLKANKLADAKAKAAEAGKLTAAFGPSDDTPDALARDVMADGKKQIDELTAACETAVAKKDYTRAEMSGGLAKTLAADLGLPTAAVDEKLAATTAAKTGTVVAVVVPPPMPVVPVMKEPMPAASGPALPAMSVAVATPAVAVAPPMLPLDGDVPLALPVPSAAPVVASSGPGGKVLLAQAQTELRRGELEAARKLAVQAHDDPAAKDDAQALLRQIGAEDTVRKQKDATASLKAAAEAIQSKQFGQAAGVLRVIEADTLSDAQKLRHNELMAQALAGSDTQVLPPAAPAASGLADQVKALGEVEFQKLRSEGLEAQTKSAEAWKKGDTDTAVGLLGDYIAKVKASNISASRQPALTSAAQSRLDNYRVMKHHTDFVLKEKQDKAGVRDRVAGRQLADQMKKDEIGKKAREVNDLVKGHKYRDAEALALQLKTLDPDDPALTALYEVTKMKRRQEVASGIKSGKEQMVLDGLNSAETEGPFVDYNRPVAQNVERSLIAMRRGTGNESLLKTRTAAEREIEHKLDSTMSVDFKGVPLKEALAELRRQVPGGLNISLDDAALAEKQMAVDGVLVTETLKDVSLRNVLDIVLKKGRLKFVVENDVVQVTTEERAKGRLVTKVFSVMDLIVPIPDYALYDHQDLNKSLQKLSNANSMSPWERMAPSGGGGYTPPNGLGGGSTLTGGGMPGGPAPWAQGGGNAATLQNETMAGASNLSTQAGAPTTKAANFQKLMGVVKGMVRPYAWQDQGGAGSLSYYDLSGALVVNQTADIIREVEDLLESLRRLQETSISVEIRVISLSEAFFERVGVDFSMNVVTKGSGKNQFERALTTGQFRPEPFTNSIGDTGHGAVIGYNPAGGGFTPDLNVPIRSTSYPLSTPPFGGYQGSLNPNLNGGLSVGLAFLNDIQVFMFMEAAQGDRRVNIMQAPKITLFNGQTANVAVSDFSFFTLGLQAFNVGGQFVYVPQNVPLPIGNAPAPPGTQQPPGISVAVQGIVSADRRFVRLNLTPQLSSLTSATVPLFPVTAFVTPVFEGGSQGVPIPFTQFFQQPSISEISVQTTVACPDGGTVVLGGLKTMSEGRTEAGPPVLSNIPYLNRLFRNTGVGRETRHIMIMVTPRIIIQSEEELNQTGLGGQNSLPPPTAGQ